MRKILILFMITIMLFISSCRGDKAVLSPKIEEAPVSIVSKQSLKEVGGHSMDRAEFALLNMTVEEKIGQMFIVGFHGTAVNQSILNMISDYSVGGIILFDRNVENAKQLLSLTTQLKEANRSNKHPLFISMDEEGGRVSRLPGESKKFPSSMHIGSRNNRTVSYNNGYEIACELCRFGINMNFAPVLDIHSNPYNTVIGDRSFGNNPDVVTQHGIETMKGLQSMKIIPVIKHFPGHGDTDTDSHTDLPMVQHDRTRLDGFELIPFKEAIKNGADVVMTSHILFPKLDNSARPATMSKVILTGILRGELGFNGVIITDDMEMDAIAKNFNLRESVLESVSAGADIILICHSIEKQKTAFNELKAAVQNGSISIERINESAKRIIRLKQKYLDD